MVLSPSCTHRPSPRAHADFGPRGVLAGPHSARASPTRGHPGGDPRARAPAPQPPQPGHGAQPRANESSGISFIQCGARLLPGKGRGAAPGAGPPRFGGEGGARPAAGPIGAAPGGGGGDQAFFPSARDQSRLYKLELLPPSDERARPRRYPAAPAPGAGAALTLPAPGGPCRRRAPQPPPGPGGAGPCPAPNSLVFPWGEMSRGGVGGEARPLSTSRSGVQRINLGKGEEEAPGLEGARDGWRSA